MTTSQARLGSVVGSEVEMERGVETQNSRRTVHSLSKFLKVQVETWREFCSQFRGSFAVAIGDFWAVDTCRFLRAGRTCMDG